MSLAVETFGFFMGALGLLMLGVTLSHSSWRVSTVHGSVITTNTIFENLWFSCATDSMGVSNCREFPSLLALSGRRWGQRQGADAGGRLEEGEAPGDGGRCPWSGLRHQTVKGVWIGLSGLWGGGQRLEVRERLRPTCPPALTGHS